MSAKATKSRPNHDVASVLAVEADQRRQDQVDAFLARNRDVLNEDLRRSRAEVANGEHSPRSLDEIIAEGRRRNDQPG
jgi:hypothetical protein